MMHAIKVKERKEVVPTPKSDPKSYAKALQAESNKKISLSCSQSKLSRKTLQSVPMYNFLNFGQSILYTLDCLNRKNLLSIKQRVK